MKKYHIVSLLLMLILIVYLLGCQQEGAPVPVEVVDEVPTQVDILPTVADSEMVEPEIEERIEEAESESIDPSAESSAAKSLAGELEGLSLDDFYEVSTRVLTLRYPEEVVAMGLTDLWGVEERLLNDISDSYRKETFELIALMLEVLESYDRNALPPEDQVSYDVYHWHLNDLLAEKEFMYHDYPATYYYITAVHEDTLQFFTDIHPIRMFQDAQDYVTRLKLVDEKIYQLIDNLEIRAKAGITPPKYAIDWAVYGSLGQFVETSPKNTALFTALQEKMMPLSSGTPEEMEALLVEAEKIIEDEVLPAYKDLHIYLSRLETYPGGDSGVWRLPQGDSYYASCLLHHTTTDLSAEEIHELGLMELDRIHGEMRKIFDQLGYDQDITIVQAFDRVAQEGGHVQGDEVLEEYETLIAEAYRNLDVAFDIRPKAEVIVVPDTYGDYYVHPAVDGSRPGAFYAGVSGFGKDAYAMPTLAYHETIPGHHMQIALAQDLKHLPSFRQGLSFSAFAEGWALYAERIAWELGWYDDNPYGVLGFLQSQAFRAARLVVDTGLHAEGWTFDQAQAFLTENTGFEERDNVNPEYQIARYLVWPAQSTSYYIGYLKFMELRERAMEALGDKFDLKNFHRVVLTNGSMPLEVLETVVDDWIENHVGG